MILGFKSARKYYFIISITTQKRRQCSMQRLRIHFMWYRVELQH